MFGIKGPETKHTDYHNAFEIAFRKETLLQAWERVGAAPLTCSCLASHKVFHEGGDEGDIFENV